jgi:hypothetical protein
VNTAPERWFLVADGTGAPISRLVCKRMDPSSLPRVGVVLNPLQSDVGVCAGLISKEASRLLGAIAMESEALGLKRQMARYGSMMVMVAMEGDTFQQNVLSARSCTAFLPKTDSGLIWLITSSSLFRNLPEETTRVAPFERDELLHHQIQLSAPKPEDLISIASPSGIGYTMLRRREDVEYIAAVMGPIVSELLTGFHFLSMEAGQPVPTFEALKSLLEEVFLLGRKWAMHGIVEPRINR